MKSNKLVDRGSTKIIRSARGSNIPLFWQGVSGVVNLRRQNNLIDKQEKLVSRHLELAVDNATLTDFKVSECQFRTL